MANTKISELTAAGALAGTETVPVVQGGATKRTTASAIAALSGSSVWTEISRTVLGSAAANIDITSIPATYDHLRLVIKIRSTVAATATNLNIRFNNDSGANYDFVRVQAAGDGGAFDGLGGYGGAAGTIGVIPGASASAGLFGIAIVEIPEYAATDAQKILTTNSAHKESTSGGGSLRSAVYMTAWRSTTAISRVTVYPSSGNADTGSAVSLYGIGTA